MILGIGVAVAMCVIGVPFTVAQWLHYRTPPPPPPVTVVRRHPWPRCACGGQSERLIRIYDCGRVMAYSRTNGLYRATPCVPESRHCPLCKPGDPCTLHDGKETARD